MEAAADIPGFTPLAVIPLSCDSQEGPPEWAMIELQGELERRDPVQPGQEFAFGQLKHSSTKEGVMELVIGYHLLEGTAVKLKKPLAVLEKRAAAADASMAEADPPSASGSPAATGDRPACSGAGQPGPLAPAPSVEYKVIGVIRQKCLFKNRPRAIISKAEPSGGGTT